MCIMKVDDAICKYSTCGAAKYFLLLLSVTIKPDYLIPTWCPTQNNEQQDRPQDAGLASRLATPLFTTRHAYVLKQKDPIIPTPRDVFSECMN